jgi:hypothetical protein
MKDVFFSIVYLVFDPLANKYGFKIVEETYYEKHFGDCIVDLESDKFRIRVTKDRSQIFIYIASLTESDKWYDLGIVLEIIGHPTTSSTPLESTQILNEGVELIMKYYDSISKAFDKVNYQDTKMRLNLLITIRGKWMEQ